jgi:hypothetical protein
MNGDQQFLELLQGQTRIEAIQQELVKKMDQYCDFKEGALQKFQEFDDYKAQRGTMPSEISTIKADTEKLKTDFSTLKRMAEDTANEVSTIKQWLNKASGIQIIVSAIIILISIASPFIMWYLGAR